MTTAHVVFSSTAAAPLFAHYDGQVQPQPAHITLNTETGAISADYSGIIGNGCSTRLFDGRDQQWRVRNDLTSSQVKEVLTALVPLMQKILDLDSDCSETRSELYYQVEDAIAAATADLENTAITDLAEWLTASGDESAWLPGEDADIEEYINNFDLDGYTAAEDVGYVLMELWANKLYNGEPLPSNVAQALIDDGRCNDSAWTEELAANAAGRVHENQE